MELLSRKDQEDRNQKDCVEKIEDRIVNISMNLGNDGSQLNPWREQRKKSAQKLKEPEQLSLFNRFSFWEDENGDESDGSDDEDGRLDKDCSDQLSLSPQVVENKWKVIESQNKRQRQKVTSKRNKKHCESIETNSSFHVFQTEDDIESIINKSEIQTGVVLLGDDLHNTTSSKIKCRKCGYKKNCMKTNSCHAEDKFCSFCQKMNHFPQSLDCTKKRKLNQKKKKKNMTRYGCQTLREFLSSKSFQLSSYNIPYDDLSKIHKHRFKMQKKQQPIFNINKKRIDSRKI